MKYFQSLRTYMAILGIDSAQKPFNQKISKIFLLYTVYFALNCVFLVRETNSFRKFIDSMYMTAAAAMVTIFFAITALKMTKIFELIETMEEFSNNSE